MVPTCSLTYQPEPIPWPTLQPQVEPYIFWKFLDIDVDKTDCFSLGAFLRLAGQGHECLYNLINGLLQTQVSAVECFFDKLRANTGISFARQYLPPFLRTSSFDDVRQWLLRLHLREGQGTVQFEGGAFWAYCRACRVCRIGVLASALVLLKVYPTLLCKFVQCDF